MAEETGKRVKVILRWIQILDDLEPFYEEKGEFRFNSRISSDADGGTVKETKFPEKGHYEISDHPAWNKIGLDKVLFEGPVADELVVELSGEEIDVVSAHDQLARYRRVFTGPPDQWMGRYAPGDEASDDPENMSNWRVCYEIIPA